MFKSECWSQSVEVRVLKSESWSQSGEVRVLKWKCWRESVEVRVLELECWSQRVEVRVLKWKCWCESVDWLQVVYILTNVTIVLLYIIPHTMNLINSIQFNSIQFSGGCWQEALSGLDIGWVYLCLGLRWARAVGHEGQTKSTVNSNENTHGHGIPQNPLQERYFQFSTLISTLWLQHSHFNTLTSTLSLQHSDFNTLTSTLWLKHSDLNTLTSTHQSKLQDKIISITNFCQEW